MPFIGVYAAARIVKQSGESVDLLGPDRSWLTSVSVSRKMGGVATIEVGFDAPYRQGVELLESDLLDIGNILCAKLGYSVGGYMSPWYSGILKQPSVQISPNGVAGTLQAVGAGGLALVQGSGKSWGPTSRWKIVQSIAAKYGWEVEASDSAEGILDVDDDFSDSQGGLDDWSFLTRVCEGKNVVITSTNSVTTSRAVLDVRYRPDALISRPKRTFILMGNFDLSKNQYPVVSFNCDTDPGTVFANAATRSVLWQSIDKDGNVKEFQSSPTLVSDKALAAKSVQTGLPYKSYAYDTKTGTVSDVPANAGDDPEGSGVTLPDLPHGDQDAVDAYMTKAMIGFPGLKITVETVGIPNMQPWEIHEVRGASARFDGKYWVDSIADRVDSGGYSTTWTGIRNALSVSEKAPDAADPNTTKPIEDSEAIS